MLSSSRLIRPSFFLTWVHRRQQHSEAEVVVERVRNIGVVAHVDAGKTTTCERMLHYSGVTRRIGDVDSGNTVLDFMKLEQERGITIKAAAITFNWEGHKINLIDTPGHVDFMFEVERSVRVLDGAVAIFDGVAGVQAQSETVWRQARKYGVPVIAYINKLDREGASLERAADSMRVRLGARPLLLQLPLPTTLGVLEGVIDVVDMRVIRWTDPSGKAMQVVDLTPEEHPGLYAKALQARETLLEQLADADEAIMRAVLEEGASAETVAGELLHGALRRVTLAGEGVPVVCGSSLRNRGVQPLLAAICRYLPSPLDRPPVRAVDMETGQHIAITPDGPDLCALAFKVVHDVQRGLMVYLRIYSGELTPATEVYNSTRQVKERVSRLLNIQADDMTEVGRVGAGNIVAALGLKDTCTGDTLLVPAKGNKKAHKGQHAKGGRLLLEGIDPPPPVFFCSIEPESLSAQKALDDALGLLRKEDPSFSVSLDPETGQTLLSAMGELHLEILKDRILNHYRVGARVGNVRVSYRATVGRALSHTLAREYEIGGVKQHVELTLDIEPTARAHGNEYQNLAVSEALKGAGAKESQALEQALAEGVANGCRSGLFFGFPLEDVRVAVTHLAVDPGVSPTALKAASADAVKQAALAADPTLLEPIMKLELMVDESALGTVVGDMASGRRGMVRAVHVLPHHRLVEAEAPLKELLGYSTLFRSLTRGSGSFTMEFLRYGDMGAAESKKLQDELRRGF